MQGIAAEFSADLGSTAVLEEDLLHNPLDLRQFVFFEPRPRLPRGRRKGEPQKLSRLLRQMS